MVNDAGRGPTHNYMTLRQPPWLSAADALRLATKGLTSVEKTVEPMAKAVDSKILNATPRGPTTPPVVTGDGSIRGPSQQKASSRPPSLTGLSPKIPRGLTEYAREGKGARHTSPS